MRRPRSAGRAASAGGAGSWRRRPSGRCRRARSARRARSPRSRPRPRRGRSCARSPRRSCGRRPARPRTRSGRSGRAAWCRRSSVQRRRSRGARRYSSRAHCLELREALEAERLREADDRRARRVGAAGQLLGRVEGGLVEVVDDVLADVLLGARELLEARSGSRQKGSVRKCRCGSRCMGFARGPAVPSVMACAGLVLRPAEIRRLEDHRPSTSRAWSGRRGLVQIDHGHSPTRSPRRSACELPSG